MDKLDAQVNLEGLKYCPRCAAVLEERDVRGHYRLVCPRCGYVFYLTPAPVTCVLVDRDGAVLLVKRKYPPKPGHWCLPAGFVEVGEAPAESAAREVKEETGLDVEIVDLIDSWSSDEDPRTPVVTFAFRARIRGGTLRPGDDAEAAAFFEEDEVPPNIAFTTHRLLIARHFERVRESRGKR